MLIGKLDETVRKFLVALRKKGGVVNTVVAIAVAKALIAKSSNEHLKAIDLDSSSWAKSLFQRMGYVKRASTTGKPEIPYGAKKEAGLVFHHQIAKFVERYEIPPSLIINIDQTPSKLAPVSSRTMAKKNSKHVSIAGATDKKAITATFAITQSNDFLPMQLIYGGKTKQSFPRFKFPASFSLSVNPKHFSNTTESLKLLDEIIIPYVVKERKERNLEETQYALLIMDVFRGQITEAVINKLRENNILTVRVPANMTNIFQPLDLTVNGSAKSFMKRKFTEWYSTEIGVALNQGIPLDDIEIKLQLSVLKPLHASWLVELFNYMTSEKGRKVIENGWKAAGILEAIIKGTSGLEPLDPFAMIDPLDESSTPELCEQSLRTTDPNENFISPRQDEDSEDDYEEMNDSDGEPVRNIFEILNDEEA